jgi:hypothetical protein
MKHTASALALATITVLVAGCAAPSVHVRVDHDPAHSIASYKTFGFHRQQSTDGIHYSTLLTSHLKDSTRQQLERRGYVYSEDQPQLLVNFIVSVERQQEVRATPVSSFAGVRAGYRGWGAYDVTTVTTRQGTLTIDLVDAASRSLVWQGIGEGAVSRKAERNTSAAVSAAVSEIFRNFPSTVAP